MEPPGGFLHSLRFGRNDKWPFQYSDCIPRLSLDNLLECAALHRFLRPSLTVLFCLPLLCFSVALVSPGLYAQSAKVTLTPAEQAIADQLHGLRGIPDDKRGQKTIDIALQIRGLPAATNKVRLAVVLAGLSTEGDFGHDALQAVATTLSLALKETPIPSKDGEPTRPYVELASLVKYEHVTTELNDPQLVQAQELLEKQQADVQRPISR